MKKGMCLALFLFLDKTKGVMETIRVKWEVNVSEGTEQIELEELECETIEDWEAIDKEEQRERLQIALDERPCQVHSVVEW